MENKLINELYRINQLMGVDDVIVESVTTPIVRSLQTLFSKISDDVVDKFVIKTGIQATDDSLDNIVNKLRAGEPIGKKSLNLLISQIDGNKLAKIFTKSKILLGDDFYNDIIRYEKLLKSDPKKYKQAVDSINTIIDNIPYLKNLPDNLKKALKLELKGKMDNAVKLPNKTYSTIKWLDVVRKGFLEGWRAPGIIRSVFNWNTFIPNQNIKGWQLALRWFFTGTTRSIPKGFKEVYSVLVKKGVSEDFAKILATKIISVPSEVFARWVIINGVVFVFNLIVAYVRENGGDKNSKRKNGELVKFAWEDIKNNWGEFSPHWVWPVATVWGPIINIVDGIIRRETPGEIYDKIKLGQLPEQKEKEKLDSEIENAGENRTIIDKIKDKKDEIVNTIENTPLGFESFVKSKGLTIKTPYITGGVGQTNEPDPNGVKTNNWWFNPDTNTFESY